MSRLGSLCSPLSGCLALTLFFVVNDAVKIAGALFELPIENCDLLCGCHGAATLRTRLHAPISAGSGSGGRATVA